MLETELSNGSHRLAWFALKTKASHEKGVAEYLSLRGYEPFVPSYRTKRKWSDRNKEVDVPYFPGYAFCRLDPQYRLPVLTTPGVQFIVGRGRVPEAIEDREMESIRGMVQSGVPVLPWPYLNVGEEVRIVEGPLAGVEGLLVSVKNSWRVVVSIDLLQRSLAAEVDRAAVRPVQARSPRALSAAS